MHQTLSSRYLIGFSHEKSARRRGIDTVFFWINPVEKRIRSLQRKSDAFPPKKIPNFDLIIFTNLMNLVLQKLNELHCSLGLTHPSDNNIAYHSTVLACIRKLIPDHSTAIKNIHYVHYMCIEDDFSVPVMLTLRCLFMTV
jgi:hypothetical protein